MRHIQKTTEPSYLTAWKEARHQASQRLSYEDFDKKRELNELLRSEQHHVCCYCQQALTHFQTPKLGGAHNEHLIPQSTDPGDGSIEVDYYNIFACCIDSRGFSKAQQHCGESKHNTLIRGFIKETHCTSFFRYNMLGEIVPNGIYDNWADYTNNKATLAGDVKDAYEAIRILNLNCNQLVADRKGDAFALLSIISRMPKSEVEKVIALWEQENRYFRYMDMLLYYMRRKR